MNDKNNRDSWAEAENAGELLREGEPDASIAEAERVIAENPSNEYAHFFMGCALFEKGEFARAMKAFVLALEIAPTYVGAMVHLGQTLRMLGRHDEALRVAHQVLARVKDDPDALHLIGLIHFTRGDTRSAVQYLERFLLTRPEIEVAMEVEGMLQTLRGEVIPFPTKDTLKN
ncbi:MAG: tetratricopeptide repeat protein [Sandaracinaceae bacterium]|nr:tetratricopeptide repeat protein [Sandaracinaceae bacterium]